MTKLNQKGAIDMMFVVLLVVLLVVGGFVAWRVTQADSETAESAASTQAASESTEQTTTAEQSKEDADTTASNEYSNEKFGFSLEIPSGLTQSDAREATGHEGAGESLSFNLGEDIFVTAKTDDYGVGPKGPLPLSTLINPGYTDSSVERSITIDQNGETREVDSLEKLDNYVFIENEITFGEPGLTEYMAVFNTNSGGLVIVTENPDLANTVKEIAKTVEVL